METIKIIDEKTIERNGIKYVPEKAEKPEFKVGQWIIYTDHNAPVPIRRIKTLIYNRGEDDGYVVTNLYYKGKFAEIIPDKKKPPVTKDEFHSFINDVIKWFDDDNNPIQTQNEFLNQYKW